MNIENLPEGLMVLKREGIWHSYRLACSCYDPRDEFEVEVEWDKETNEVSLLISADMHTRYSSLKRFWLWEKVLNVYKRICLSLRILLIGYYETSGCLTFKGDDQINSFIYALQWSRKQVEKSGREYGDYESHS